MGINHRQEKSYNQPLGQVSLSGDQLIVEFSYSPDKVQEIKKIPSARFNKERKHWTVQLKNCSYLENSKSFSRDNLVYSFSAEDLPIELKSEKVDLEEILSRVKENPFSVAEEDLKNLRLDLVIRLDFKQTSLRALPSFSSKARKILEKIPGAHYIKTEKSYFLPTEELTALLKKLRDLNLLFAVEATAGKILSASAKLRAEILNQETIINENNLSAALLCPFIEVLDYFDESGSETYFCLKNYTTTQLREIFPNISSFDQRKNLAKMFDQNTLFKVVQRLKDLKWKLWLSDKVQEMIRQRGEAFAEISAKEREAQQLLLERSKHFNALKDVNLNQSIFSDQSLEQRLYPHQRVAMKWLLETPFSFLGDDMGLGKTLSVLSSFVALQKTAQSDFLLVICPNSLTRNWLREAANWFPELRLLMLPQEKKEKISFLKKLSWGDYKINGLVINYEAIRLDYVLPEIIDLLQTKNTLLCLDESQRVKSPNAQTFQAISQLAPLCQRRVLLSGTPTPKDISDIWSQMYLLDGGERFGKSYYRWLEQVAELGTKYSDFAVKKFKPQMIKETISRLHEVLLRRKKEDVVDLPEKIFITRDIDLTGEQRKRYEEIRKELLLRVTSTNGKTFIREINNILEEYLRAVQVASNPRLIDETWKGEPAKFKELDLLVEDIVSEREEKLVIWTNYLGNIRELTKRYEKYGAKAFSGEVSTKERDETIKKFQNSNEVKILVAVPAAGGVGITLTAAQTAIYLDKTWNAEHWMQSIDRLHRIGQTGTVRIISLQASKVDELIARNLNRKTRFQNEVLKMEGILEESLEIEREEFIKAVR